MVVTAPVFSPFDFLSSIYPGLPRPCNGPPSAGEACRYVLRAVRSVARNSDKHVHHVERGTMHLRL